MNWAAKGLVVVTAWIAVMSVCGSERPLVFGVNHVGGDGLVGSPPGYRDALWEEMARGGVPCSRMAASWRELEPQRGVYDWSELDEEVARAARWGIVPIPLIVNTPGWASPTGEPTHAWAPREDAAEAYEEFLRRLVARTREHTRYYEFWNEQNGWGWHTDGVRYSFVAEYIPWMRRTYRVIKEEYPEAVVALGGMDDAGGYAPTYLRLFYELRDLWYPGEDLFDAVADHPYSPDAATMKRKVDALLEVMRANGDGDKTIWITEYGYHTAEMSEDAQADRLHEILAAMTSPEWDSVEIATYLCISDFENRLGGFGLTDPNLRPKRSYEMYRAMPKPASGVRSPPPIPAHDRPNGGFEDGFRAGIAVGWEIEGRDICRDGAGLVPEVVRGGAHSQAVLVPKRSSRGIASVLKQRARASLPLTVEVWARRSQGPEGPAPATVRVEFATDDGTTVSGEPAMVGDDWVKAACRWPGGATAPWIRIQVASDKPDKEIPVVVVLDDVTYLVEE